MSKTIVVPVDGSDQSKKALDFSVDLALHYPAELKIVYVIEPFVVEDVFSMSTIPVPVDMDDLSLEKYGKEVLDKAEGICKDLGANNISKKVLKGDPGKAIVAFAEDANADMIVIGSRGLGNLSGMFLGSVSKKVAHDANCTCITVK